MQDPYYQTLPFTLTEDQLNYDFLILGTNLQACLLAAHLTKIQKKIGLVLELEKGYGGDIKTLSLKQLHEFMTNKRLSSQTLAPLQFEPILTASMIESNNDYIAKKKETSRGLRGYNIDLQPRVFSGSSFACEMLKDGNMDQYMDFRVIKKVLFLMNGKLEEVPLNLKTIMNAQSLSLFQRKDLFKGVHQLVKIYYKYHSVEVDNNSTNQFDKDTDVNEQLYQLFLQQRDKVCHHFLLKVFNNKQKLFDMVMYGICGYQYKKPPSFIEHQYTSLEMIKRFGRFVKSCGVYSQTPYLYVDNGIGDIPQAFSRIASIFGTTFIIHPRIEVENIEKGEEKYEISSNLCPGQKITAKTIQFTEPYFNYISPLLQIAEQPHYQRVLRLVLISKTPEQFKHQGPLLIHSFDNTSFVNPVLCFLFDSHSSNCPEDEHVLHLSTILGNQDNIEKQVQNLLSLADTIFGKQDIQYISSYIQTNSYCNNQQHIIQNDWNFDLETVFEYFKQMIGEQEKYFKDESIKQNNGDEDDGYYEGLLSKLENLKEKKEDKQKKEEIEEIADEEAQQTVIETQQTPVEFQQTPIESAQKQIQKVLQKNQQDNVKIQSQQKDQTIQT